MIHGTTGLGMAGIMTTGTMARTAETDGMTDSAVEETGTTAQEPARREPAAETGWA